MQQELEIQQKEQSKKHTIIEEQKKQLGEKYKSLAKNNLLSEQIHKLEEKLSEAQIKLKVYFEEKKEYIFKHFTILGKRYATTATKQRLRHGKEGTENGGT